MDILIQISIVILSAVLPLLVALSVRQVRKLRPERELTLRLRSQASLPEPDLEPKTGLLEMRWAGESVDRLVVSRWSLANSGSQPIRRGDFDSSLRINFPSQGFLGASVYGGDPPQLESRVRTALSTSERGFELQPLLWNTKEVVDLTVVTKEPIDNTGGLDIDARIVSGRVRVVDDTGTDRARTASQQRRILIAMSYAGIMAATVTALLAMLYR